MIHTVIEDEEIDDDKYNEEEGWEFVMVEGQKIGIKTSILEDKCTAVEMLICYAQEMGAAFHPYVEKVLGVVVPLLKFYFHDGVRFAAASVIPMLFKSIVQAQYRTFSLNLAHLMIAREVVLNTWHDVCEKMLNVITAEPDPTFVAHLFMSFHECIAHLGKMSMTPDLLQKFTAVVQNQLSEYLTRISDREGKSLEAGTFLAHDELWIGFQDSVRQMDVCCFVRPAIVKGQ